jgi:NAD-dependent deacetylase
MVDDINLDNAARIIAKSERLVVFTGAGMSKESGVPTFRDALEGLWAKYDPMKLATPEAFRKNPKLVWDWYSYRRDLLSGKQPNPGHYAVAELEDLLPQVVVITQNIDGFHHEVGSTDVICLHGDLKRDKCFASCCGNPTYVDVSQLSGWDTDSGPPLCPYCGDAYVRPDVVWFTESLPYHALTRATELARQADVMLVIGTSGVVWPAAGLTVEAKQAGATLVEINPNPSEITPITTHFLQGPSGEVMPEIVNRVRELFTR